MGTSGTSKGPGMPFRAETEQHMARPAAPASSAGLRLRAGGAETRKTDSDRAGPMAAALVAALPLLLLFVAFGERIVTSIGFSGLK
jgi:ABC-type glycerol-3-phosphate transport system permease component